MCKIGCAGEESEFQSLVLHLASILIEMALLGRSTSIRKAYFLLDPEIESWSKRNVLGGF